MSTPVLYPHPKESLVKLGSQLHWWMPLLGLVLGKTGATMIVA
jgi:hypothetical protein